MGAHSPAITTSGQCARVPNRHRLPPSAHAGRHGRHERAGGGTGTAGPYPRSACVEPVGRQARRIGRSGTTYRADSPSALACLHRVRWMLRVVCSMLHAARCILLACMSHVPRRPVPPMARLLPGFRRTGTCLLNQPLPSPFQASWIAGCESAWARAAPPVLALAIIALVGTRAWVDAW